MCKSTYASKYTTNYKFLIKEVNRQVKYMKANIIINSVSTQKFRKYKYEVQVYVQVYFSASKNYEYKCKYT